jgi:hypothetical protein|tara:strand:+ start:762 stop:872 length:111 start_codon:yes stop_codon:yes gene_type:complete
MRSAVDNTNISLLSDAFDTFTALKQGAAGQLFDESL